MKTIINKYQVYLLLQFTHIKIVKMIFHGDWTGDDF